MAIFFGTAAANLLVGSDGADEIRALGGDDTVLGVGGNDTLFGNEGNDSVEGGPDDDALYGGQGNDTLQGGDRFDVLFGNQGNDLLLGEAGDDTLFGGQGNDTLRGGAGNDSLRGDDGNDLLFGDEGNDTLAGGAGFNGLVVAGGDRQVVTIVDFSPARDVLVLTNGLMPPGSPNSPLALVTAGANTLLFNGDRAIAILLNTAPSALSAANFTNVVAAPSGPPVLPLTVGNRINLGLGDGPQADLIRDVPPLTPVTGEANANGPANSAATIVTTPFADEVFGRGGNDTILGLDGNDSLFGNEGDDVLYGNRGSDLVVGGTGNDSLFGGQNDDSLLGEEGNDELFGNLGNDTLRGGAGDDRILGGQGDDLIFGEEGNDVLAGDLGNDTLEGGGGFNLFVVDGREGLDLIRGFDPTRDRLGLAGGLTPPGSGPNSISLVASGLNDTAVVGNGRILAILEGLTPNRLGSGNFTTTLAPQTTPPSAVPVTPIFPVGPVTGNRINVGLGDGPLGDRIGAVVPTTPVTGEANANGPANAPNTLIATPFGDLILGRGGNDTLEGLGGNDTLFGNEGDDWLLGADGDDLLDGGDGNDVLSGGLGNDTATGGNGLDVFVLTPGGNLTVTDFNPAQDFLGLSGGLGAPGSPISPVVISQVGGNTAITSGNQVLANLLNTNANQVSANNFTPNLTPPPTPPTPLPLPITVGNRINLNVGDGPLGDRLGALVPTTPVTGQANANGPANAPNTLIATPFGDLILGRVGNDTIEGLGGNDSLQGNEGDDLLFGGDGDDLLEGNDGNDVLFGGPGNDTVSGGNGVDVFVLEGGGTLTVLDFNPAQDFLGLSSPLTAPGTGANAVTLTQSGANTLVLSSTGQLLATLSNTDATRIGLTGFTPNLVPQTQPPAPVISVGNRINTGSNDGPQSDRIGAVVPTTPVTGEANANGPANSPNTIVATPFGDVIFGRGGNDTLEGLGGNDTLFGNEGNDFLFGGDGEDSLEGGQGNDVLDGGAGNDTLLGGEGNDSLQGGTGNDSLMGGAGNNTLVGGPGDDVLIGMGVLDTFRFETVATNGLDTLTGFGNGLLDFTAENAGGAFRGNPVESVAAFVSAPTTAIGNANILVFNGAGLFANNAAGLTGLGLNLGTTGKVAAIYSSAASGSPARIAIATLGSTGAIASAVDVAVLNGVALNDLGNTNTDLVPTASRFVLALPPA
ncbi:MAG: calcium-binding protein [Pseudanabaenaceae cyanobacterium]